MLITHNLILFYRILAARPICRQ